MDKEFILDFIKKTTEEGLNSFTGNCGLYAVALNQVLFGNKGELIAVESYPGEGMIDHVAVKYEGSIYDSTGEIDQEDLYSWCEEIDDAEEEFSPEIFELDADTAIECTNCCPSHLGHFVSVMINVMKIYL